MTRQFIATLLSAALLATSFTAAPARADEDVAKVLAGLIALGIIAKAIDDRNDRKATVTRRNQQVYRYGKGYGPRHGLKPRPRFQKIAPNRCLRDQWTHRGNRQVYGARCMQRHANAQLPQACLRQARTNSGPRYFYTPRCLRERGWRA